MQRVFTDSSCLLADICCERQLPRLQESSCEIDTAAPNATSVNFVLALPGVEQTVTVTADAAKASLEQIPGNTALVDTQTIARSLGVTLKDVLAFTPGVLVQPRFGADESQFSIRGSGLRSNFHERGINLFINGTPYQDADGFSDFEALELQSLRQVEVWKGANALRYGGTRAAGQLTFLLTAEKVRLPSTFRSRAALTGCSKVLFPREACMAP